jgi:hypothetical protein
LEAFRNVERPFAALAPNAAVMRSIIVEWLAHVSHPPRKSHGHPKLPVATHAKALVRTANTFKDGSAKNDGTGVGDGIGRYEVVSAFFIPLNAEIRFPSVRV